MATTEEGMRSVSGVAAVDLHTRMIQFCAHHCMDASMPSPETTAKSLSTIGPWVFFVVIVLLQVWPFLTSPWTQTCMIEGTEVSFGTVMLTLLPFYLSSCFVACCAAFFFAHWDRSPGQARICFWTIRYLIMSTLNSALHSAFMCISCNSVGKAASALMILFGFLSWICSLVILARLAVSKLRIAASMAPKAERIGSAAAKVFSFLLPLQQLARLFALPLLVQSLLLFLVILAIIALYGCVVFTMHVSARAMTKEAARLDVDADTAAQILQSSRLARAFAAAITIAGVGTIASVCPIVNVMVADVLFSLETVFNAAACVALSGVSKGRLDSSAIIKLGVSLTEAERFRQIENRLCGIAGDSTGSALMITALMGNAKPLEVLEHSIARFRCIRWEVLQQRPDIILGGAPLDVLGPGKDDLYSLSEPCRLGDCDAFFSHSWHDNGTVKWQALCCLCDEFKVVHGRFPRLWLDKVCIDQANIEVDLQCLPVFLAGCNGLFAAGGTTYHTRLWCVMELLVYRAMLIQDPERGQPVVWAVGNESDEIQRVREGWVNIDVRDCECFKAEDKEQFMRVVQAFPGGIDRFNSFMRNVGQTIDKNYIQDYDEVLDI